MLAPWGHPALVLALVLGCGGGRKVDAPPPRTEPMVPETRAGREAPRGEPLDEASARRLLSARFRAAGFRVLEDVALEAGGVTLLVDGFDPARRVGYEYVAAEEEGIELDESERERAAQLDGVRLLVQGSGPAAELERAADRFFGALN